ncbi:hypothetical protein [Allobranchiibius sp. CTAmp26]|uniref:hypothetical protein n=1 Tax=Allobranchiibius sp. CTAmp26 TaxID=2815214 RepID=UPI001AA1B41C|nr:hypothetical protein [Allobranchiibius sp. CTAmp26]MBO1754839.1 hypothetical protein [Allobranchiibius sp. CTAmp26]
MPRRQIGAPLRWRRYYQPEKFFEVEHEVYRKHANALEREGLPAARAWRHSGGTDLVSFLCHHGEPDWLSLTASRIDSAESTLTLAEVASAQERWSQGRDDPLFWASQLKRRTDGQDGRLEEALERAAAAVGAGVLAAASYDLVKQIWERR